MESKVTIYDVAEQAGVSVSTVSRVLNKPGSVSENKRNAVFEAINRLNYVPNPVARTMGGKKTGTIAVVVPNISNGTISTIVDGIASEAEQQEFNILLFTTNESTRKEEQYITSVLKSQMINGAIFICGTGTEIDFSPLLRVMPVVVVDRFETDPRLISVGIDDYDGFSLIINHLKDLGHQKIGYLAGNVSKMSGQHRLNKFLSVMRQEGLDIPRNGIASSNWTLRGGYDAGKQLLYQYPQMTAIISSSDVLAIGALSALKDSGIRVPKDISIVGFDNFPSGEFSSPSLTTLQYPAFNMGYIAIKQLIRQIINPGSQPKSFVLPVNLLKRDSTCRVSDTD